MSTFRPGPANEAPAQQRVRPRVPPDPRRDRFQLQGPGRVHAAARSRPGPAGAHRHSAGLDGRLDCPVRQRPHPGHGAGRGRPTSVHLPPGLAREKGPAQVRPCPPARRNAPHGAPPGDPGPALRGTHPGARAGGRVPDAGQRLAPGRVRAVHQRERQPRPRHSAVRPRPRAQGRAQAQFPGQERQDLGITDRRRRPRRHRAPAQAARHAARATWTPACWTISRRGGDRPQEAGFRRIRGPGPVCTRKVPWSPSRRRRCPIRALPAAFVRTAR